jgi:8-amino-7-oxononanoate synthase
LDSWEILVREVLNGLHAKHAHRQRRQIEPIDATHVRWQGKHFINFASNDYLGLTHHAQVIEAAQRSLSAHGAGSGASALICGYSEAHTSAERRIARWKGTEASVFLPSGYQANHAAIQTLASGAKHADRPIRFLLDKLCHASLIDAVRASEQDFRVYPHNNLEKVERLLAGANPQQIQVVVTEAIFSMDGDAADLAGLARLRRKYGFVLLVDEAHSSGVYGSGGSGLASEMGLSGDVDVTVATLSKAAGCVGGAVCASKVFCEALVNFARAYIYSTSVPTHIASAVEAAIDVMHDEPHRIERVRSIAARVRTALAQTRFVIPEGDSPIVPVIMGSESVALNAAEFLAARGMLVWPIRPPTVAHGSSRLRITLSSEHSNHEVDQLIGAIQELSEWSEDSSDRTL